MPARYFQFQPEEYQSQFDSAPINILQSTLGQRQQRFDTAQANIANFNEKLADIPYLDTQAREEYLGRVQGQVEDIYDKYAGDLAAGSNELRISLSKLKQDPYLNLNRRQIEQAQLFEQARAKDPSKFIGLNDPRSISLRDVTDPAQLDAVYGIRSDYTQDITTNFAALAQNASDIIKKNTSSLGPQYFEQVKTQGLGVLSDKELDSAISDQDVKNFKARTSFDIDPNLKGIDAKRFILETINSTMGTKELSSFISNKEFVATRPTDPTPSRTPFVTSAQPGSSKASIDKIDNNLDKFKTARNSLDLANDIASDGSVKAKLTALSGSANTPSQLRSIGGLSVVSPASISRFLTSEFDQRDQDQSKYNLQQSIIELYKQFNPDDDKVYTTEVDGQIKYNITDAANANRIGTRINEMLSKDSQKLAEEQYNKAFEPYKDNASFKYLTGSGVDPVEAATVISDELREQYIVHNTGYSPTDPTVTNKIRLDLIRNINKTGSVTKYDEDGVLDEEKGNIQDILTNSELENIQLNIVDGTFEVQVAEGKIGDKVINTYKVPVGELGNANVKRGIKNYKQMLDNYYGQNGKITSTYTLPGGNEGYKFDVDYDPETKKFIRSVTHVFTQKGQTYERKSNINEFANRAVTSIFDNYGKQPTYKIRKR
jgi:cation transport regulator ChaB